MPRLQIVNSWTRLRSLSSSLLHENTTNGFLTQAHSDKCLFQLLMPGLTPVLLLESESRLEIVAQPANVKKRPTLHLLVYGLTCCQTSKRNITVGSIPRQVKLGCQSRLAKTSSVHILQFLPCTRGYDEECLDRTGELQHITWKEQRIVMLGQYLPWADARKPRREFTQMNRKMEGITAKDVIIARGSMCVWTLSGTANWCYCVEFKVTALAGVVRPCKSMTAGRVAEQAARHQ